ncbi:hypothetical protein [Ornithinimicrobium kibberense]|uniref:hypothetical protein n=1 Tax=Ornithinimicrobium kibberense TaxID=282060 RepID=UPI003614D0A7
MACQREVGLALLEVEALTVLGEVDAHLEHLGCEGVEHPGHHRGVLVLHALRPVAVGQALELQGEGATTGQGRVDLREPRQGGGEQGEPGEGLQG